jgi:RNA polymerase sigma-70 factor (ECF subfamily)
MPMNLYDQDPEGTFNKARAGDEESLAQIFEYYRNELRHFLRNKRMPGTEARADASDIIQDSFARALASLGRGNPTDRKSKDPEKPFSRDQAKAWLLTIVKRTCIDTNRHDCAQIRDSRKEVPNSIHPGDSSRQGIDPIDSGSSPSSRLSRKERDERLKLEINQLPSEQREAVMLEYFNRFSRNQIADSLGIDVYEVRKRIERAEKRLEKQLGIGFKKTYLIDK